MEIKTTEQEGKLTIAIIGCLDTTTSPKLQETIDAIEQLPKAMQFDFSKLEYISSAGLRVMLMCHKKMVAGGGELTLTGMNPQVREVFDMTGFSDILNIV